MEPRDFCECIKTEVIQKNDSHFTEFLSLPIESFKDEKWKSIRTAYESMNDSQREAMRSLAMQAMVDTASSILGILDGSTILNNYREEFSLNYGDSNQELNGNLQDYFLSLFEAQ